MKIGRGELLHGDCLELMKNLNLNDVIIVTDTPYNIKYKYISYKDNLEEKKYYEIFKFLNKKNPCVFIHYPEQMHNISICLNKSPKKIVTWVYNSNLPKQHRCIAFYDVIPDFNKVKQEFKNPNDKRIKEKIKKGITGCRLYDWWNVNQVKNVSKDKINHPCQIPVEIMINIIKILPDDKIILDPFSGSGTTAVACERVGRNWICMEKDFDYYMQSYNRIENEVNK